MSHLVENVPCRTCGVGVGEPCKTKHGTVAQYPHTVRCRNSEARYNRLLNAQLRGTREAKEGQP